MVLLGDFDAHMGNNSDTWWNVIRRSRFPHLKSSSVLLLDFCDSRSSPITNTMFEDKGVNQCMFNQETLDERSLINCVVVSSNLQPYVLDKR